MQGREREEFDIYYKLQCPKEVDFLAEVPDKSAFVDRTRKSSLLAPNLVLSQGFETQDSAPRRSLEELAPTANQFRLEALPVG